MKEFELIVMRHGYAESYSPDGDSGRRLTPEGRDRIQRIGTAWKKLGLSYALALASPYVRAQQTCELVTEHSTSSGEVITWDGMVPNSPPEETVAEILRVGRGLKAHQTLAVFGHNPNLTDVISLLLSGRTDTYVNLRPGDVAHLTVPDAMPFKPQGAEGPCAILNAFYPGKSLEKLDK